MLRSGPAGSGEWVSIDGEPFFRIANYHTMAPFLMSVVSGFDHWLFISSTGGLTCGRRDAGNALFPYYTDDKIHDARETTGPTTAFLVTKDGKRKLWQPFVSGPFVYDLERNLYKNVLGNKLVFEEINRDLGLAYRYTWSTGNRFGFVKETEMRNLGDDEVQVEVLDGLRNLLPYGVEVNAQAEMSTLIDAYKQAEFVPDACLGIYTLSSILTDRAEPSEAMKATVVWSVGLDDAQVLLSEDQLPSFLMGQGVRREALSKGKRGAFFVTANLALPAQGSHCWYLVADVEQSPAQAANLRYAIRDGVSESEIKEDVAANGARLQRLAGSADGYQKSADELITARHFSNTLFNIMRGGVFAYGYTFPREDFLDFIAMRNRPLLGVVEEALTTLEEPLSLDAALGLARAHGDPDFTRLVYEYLPLTFSRRHGDPSRPWNRFSIHLKNGDGTEYLYYEGNWRDVFQNWEALTISFPGYIESFIAKFVNASTPDGHNPYRISREGFDWEVLEPSVPWSNIGYWGDHQVGYLLRLLELSRKYHPDRLGELLTREEFVYADVPYRIKPYREMLRDPRNTVEYDHDRARAVSERVAEIGADGKLVTLDDESRYRVNLLEKLLISALAKLSSFVPCGGIWMNTQRPEWNDANNALAGYGLSMVTLCYLRRYLNLLTELLRESDVASFDVSREVAEYFANIDAVLKNHRALLARPLIPTDRKAFMDDMGAASDRYRAQVYEGFSGEKSAIPRMQLEEFNRLTLSLLDHSIAHGKRDDGLFHSYNLIRIDGGGVEVEPLGEMLEGQVAVLSSGFLDSESSLRLLKALRSSPMYREDQNSYMLYPDRRLPSFLERSEIPPARVDENDWLLEELAAGRTSYVERDDHGHVYFSGAFRNAAELKAALERDPAVDPADATELCELYETVFEHRKFTGRSGSMYKYEGLGCIYWHMVSKLLLATGEVIAAAADEGADSQLIDDLGAHFIEIQEGLGTHKRPADHGAFPVDAYSHTPGFAGVQQPGLTGQVKEDLITRFWQLGVRVDEGRVTFAPVMLGQQEFVQESTTWRFSTGEAERQETLSAGSLGFTLCGTPVIYRIADSGSLQIYGEEGPPRVIEGNQLGLELSQSLFRRESRIRKLVVNIPEGMLRKSAGGS